ncbi:retron Ec67 family RNA-directed DNA polymerase/endonuclease [Aurantimonas coralicida]|uniref:retron Ec67 family RNA-directed DNA polymerase/endonuclease n=1 Tax=Aurantimonas coralicida TaxID=182270 RepID=UPI001D18A8EE|nr:retron Ec67 family RNA-directed DNA polymerase/endonuclease [Aurantimonas coralicida]MCC4300203.1 retron Ec67 family RNA-directed DNA polymerase/endonuclease [Aurantimonas coralicida]
MANEYPQATSPISELAQLRSVNTLTHLAHLMGLEGWTLSHALYQQGQKRGYTYFSIPKKRGGFRQIAAPNSRLKMVQSKLAGLLSRIEAEMEGKRARQQCILSHGFKPGYSIITNAAQHRNKRYVFNADLKEFFPSINFGRVRGFFIHDKNFQLNHKIATIIAQIACHNNQLPQGSPCSPVISNLIAHMLDVKLNKVARRSRCTYTRYADDLTFSTNEKEFPTEIARLVRGAHDKWVPGNSVVRSVYKAGFTLNELKTRMQYRDSRQDATGLIVNEKLNVPHEYYKLARARCRHLFRNGYAYDQHSGTEISDEAVEGMMSYIYQIRRARTEDFWKEQSGFAKLYKQLLDHRSFWGITKPRIVCEGKTDNIYLRAALQSLAAKFPELYEAGAEPQDRLKVCFFNHTKRAEIFQIGSGGSELAKLVGAYKSRTKSFEAGMPPHPVIVVADNDSGSTGLFSAMSKILGTSVGGENLRYYLGDNLYVVPIPKKNGHTAIEDLFDNQVLDEKIDGRSFDRKGKQADKTKWYGKNEFATKIVHAKRHELDFAGFEAVLTAFSEVIVDYERKKKEIAGAKAALKVAA